MALPELPELNEDGIFTEVAMEKQEWKNWIKAQVKAILKEKPEAVYDERGGILHLSGRPCPAEKTCAGSDNGLS